MLKKEIFWFFEVFSIQKDLLACDATSLKRYYILLFVASNKFKATI